LHAGLKRANTAVKRGQLNSEGIDELTALCRFYTFSTQCVTMMMTMMMTSLNYSFICVRKTIMTSPVSVLTGDVIMVCLNPIPNPINRSLTPALSTPSSCRLVHSRVFHHYIFVPRCPLPRFQSPHNPLLGKRVFCFMYVNFTCLSVTSRYQM